MKIFITGRRPDSTSGKRKMVIGMLTVGVMSKQFFRHFQAFEYGIQSENPDPSDWQCRKSKTMPTDHVRQPGERTLTR